MIKHDLKLNNYSMMFNKEGFLVSVKRNNRFLRFKEVDTLRDLIKNLGKDDLSLSDLRQVISLFSIPKVTRIEERLLIENIIL